MNIKANGNSGGIILEGNVCIWSRVPQRSGSRERKECCSPASPAGPPLPHSATSVPVLQHSESNTGDN